jgi:hypothetical protein
MDGNRFRRHKTRHGREQRHWSSARQNRVGGLCRDRRNAFDGGRKNASGGTVASRVSDGGPWGYACRRGENYAAVLFDKGPGKPAPIARPLIIAVLLASRRLAKSCRMRIAIAGWSKTSLFGCRPTNSSIGAGPQSLPFGGLIRVLESGPLFMKVFKVVGTNDFGGEQKGRFWQQLTAFRRR